jgi:Fe-S oxidoreductase
MAQGGKGVVVVGCEGCKLQLQTRTQYMQHLAEDALPAILDEVLGRKAMAEA